MRTVKVLALAHDPVVASYLAGLYSQQHLFHAVGEERFGDALTLATAASRLLNDERQFDTLLLVTHGRSQYANTDEVHFFAQTAHAGNLQATHWYEAVQALDGFFDEPRALVTICCHSNQAELREALRAHLPFYAVASLGSITVPEAILGTQEFFRQTIAFEVEQLTQIEEVLDERICKASGGRMHGWVLPQ
ncbi:MAG: hypothetical protein NTW87_10915 [Planctomycetota bacterium]|nr:hypothetical protein [Planctomycetota bacterium]